MSEWGLCGGELKAPQFERAASWRFGCWITIVLRMDGNERMVHDVGYLGFFLPNLNGVRRGTCYGGT